ncbi:EamA family transporter [Legionella pneumophila]|uniref:Integral membrane protein n=1 Tax=Legionella pneumophila subsp. pascullei TaxID=91890 RepID=A0AAX2IY64_LEGPN|nr:EamA family transporter [Legionella pneumophila]AMP88958.1 O-acetylserine/cysteine exporter [Legionella pneumophila subsp. pascullei]AMP93374.1 acetylserine transporter [Legionella pneumophila subsp. pascullei]AMP96340.1 acetylserine transporter [Legionella pneumophila subsp. pascullei]SQG91310.1 integral membrane protein [Legionella pneumophila subsp. pascullei]VEH07856.1 integral membrane protein [Legionella pneumophila subsp. pascullei]
MPFAHLLLALLVVFVWGINFIFVKLSLEEFSPLLLCAARFLLASVPAVFFIKPPAVPFKIIAGYGLIMFALQFALLFIGLRVGMTPGVASLLMQVQVFFSMFFAIIFLGEQPQIGQIIGALISFIGIGVVALHFDHNVSLMGFLCILAAAASWGVGNLITKKIHSVNLIAVIVWSSFIACLPMFILSLVFEGPASFVTTYEHMTWKGILSVLYIVYISTWVGYGVWNWLISRYPVGMVVPFTLLVPVVGILSSVFILGEPFYLWKLVAGLLVISGLCINLLTTRLFVAKTQQPETA